MSIQMLSVVKCDSDREGLRISYDRILFKNAVHLIYRKLQVFKFMQIIIERWLVFCLNSTYFVL